MPAKSQAQFRLMKGVAEGSIKKPKLSRAVAKEFVTGQSPRGLPKKMLRRKRSG